MSPLNGLFKAIKHVGSQAALAKVLGRSQQNINDWINRDQKITNLGAIFQLFIALKGSIPLDEFTNDAEKIRQTIHSVILYDQFPSIELALDALKVTHPCPLAKETQYAYAQTNQHPSSLPILVDQDQQLITCECRIRDSLWAKQKKLFVHRIDLRELINQSICITPLLQLLPLSEKVAVGLAIERMLGNRQGKRKISRLPDNYPEVQSGVETRHLAAKYSGFSSEFTYRQAKLIMTHGISALIQAMDSGVISISKAKQLSELPQDEQQHFITDLLHYPKIKKTQPQLGEML